MIYKVSYVVLGGGHPGAIKNETEMPQVGAKIRLGRQTFEVVEVKQMMPPRDDFQFLHATIKLVSK
jgi:hypothetical protein